MNEKVSGHSLVRDIAHNGTPTPLSLPVAQPTFCIVDGRTGTPSFKRPSASSATSQQATITRLQSTCSG